MDVGTPDADRRRVVLTPVGEIDMSTVGGLEATLRTAVARSGVAEIVVDLADVTFLDSTGVAALLSGAAEAVGRGATLRVANPRPMVARVLRITAVAALLGLPDEPGGRSTIGQGWRGLG